MSLYCSDHSEHSTCAKHTGFQFGIDLVYPFDNIFEERVSQHAVNSIVVYSELNNANENTNMHGMCILKYQKYIGESQCIATDALGNAYIVPFSSIKAFD